MADTAQPGVPTGPLPRTAFTRRDVIKTAAGAGTLMLLPTLPGIARADDAWQSAGKSADFVKDAPTAVTLKTGAKLVITRVDEKTLTAVSTKCTHRGCEVGWSADAKQLVCPCHGAAFQSDGKNVKGTRRHPEEKLPALFSVPIRENNGSVEVNLTKVPVDALPPARDA